VRTFYPRCQLALPAMENEPPFSDAEPHQQHPPFDDAARAAAKKVAAGAGKPRTQEAGLLAIHAALHRKRFQRDEEAYTFFGAKKQRFYEWKPVVEKNDGSQLSVAQLLSVEQARKQQRTSDASSPSVMQPLRAQRVRWADELVQIHEFVVADGDGDDDSADDSSDASSEGSDDSDICRLEMELAELVPEGAQIPCDNPHPTCSCHFHQVLSELRRLQQRSECKLYAPTCGCTVLTEWAPCQFRTCFDWNTMSPHAGSGTLIRCHTCGTVRCSANCGVLIFNTPELAQGLNPSMLEIETTIGAQVRDAAHTLLDASPDSSCSLEELKDSLRRIGDFGELQVCAKGQHRVAASKPKCDGEEELIYLGGKYDCYLREILQSEETGASEFWGFMMRDDVLHRL
jgi:hypothetical protein